MFFDRHDDGERALLVHCFFSGGGKIQSNTVNSLLPDSNILSLVEKETAENAGSDFINGITFDSQISGDTAEEKKLHVEVEEFIDLTASSGVEPLFCFLTRRSNPTPKFFIGSGKVEELANWIKQHSIDVVLFNHTLSPAQERNLEKAFQCKVLDRTGLILDIFAQRARSHVGKLQVELAQLKHISTRLIRGWTHLERQKGGIGLRGPGESQLETDRRLLRERVKWINKRLDKVNAQREQGRRSRLRSELSTVALVGYTNAGKSTLFNAITRAGVYAQDQLFATLDTTLRSVELEGFGRFILADTVGFVRDLPHQLVEAFKATLVEAAEADLLLHVVDASAEEVDEQIEVVEHVLKEMGAGDIPCLKVMNKIDQLACISPRIDYQDNCTRPEKVWVSANAALTDDEQLTLLREALVATLSSDRWSGELVLTPDKAKLRAKLYDSGAVYSETITESGAYKLLIDFPKAMLERILVNEQSLLDKILG